MIELKRFLCAVDFSDFSRRALDHALSVARAYGSTVTALHVVAPAHAVVAGTYFGLEMAPPIMLPTMDVDHTGAGTAFVPTTEIRRHNPAGSSAIR